MEVNSRGHRRTTLLRFAKRHHLYKVIPMSIINMTENFSLKPLVGLSDDRLPDLQTDRLTDCQTGRLTDCQTDRLTD